MYLTSSDSMDEEQVKELMRPVKKHLVSTLFGKAGDVLTFQKTLKSGTATLSREEKISTLKDCLGSIGTQIDDIVALKQSEKKDGSLWRKHCWV